MTEKRLDKFDMLEFGDENEYWIVRCNKIGMANEEVVELLNLYEQLLTQEKEKNQQLKLQLSNISAQRDEFYRGARENANRVGKLKKENEQLKQINRNLGDFRNLITEKNVFNEKQRKELELQMLRLYNYFENYFEDTMSPNAFGEMWDNVKKDKKWEKVMWND